MPKEPYDPKDDRDPRAEIRELRWEVEQMRGMLGQVAQASSIEHVINNGLASLTAQLEPLRDLTPRRKDPSDAAAKQLQDLILALERPKWRGSTFEVHKPDDEGTGRGSRRGSNFEVHKRDDEDTGRRISP